MLTGAVGGLFGELDARLRAYIIRKLTELSIPDLEETVG